MKSWRGWAIAGGILVALFAALVVVSGLLPTPIEQATGSTTNPRPNGARAVAEVLRRNGVQVTEVTGLPEAAAAADPDSTLAIYLTQPLSQAAVAQLRDVPADVVILIGSSWVGLAELTDGLFEEDWWWREDETVPAYDCSDLDVLAVGAISYSENGVFDTSPAAAMCYLDDIGTALYADTTTPRHRLTVLGAGGLVLNGTILEEGNAALALRMLGRHPQLTWFLPGQDALAPPDDPGVSDPFTDWSLLPGWAPSVFGILLVAGAAAALWRGRRFGALVREKLPIAVPASEVSTGLGRLYRQAGARGHAAAGLRAATIGRLSARLGLPATAEPRLVVERLAEVSGEPVDALAALFYGPAPTSDSELVDLASRLTDLERKLTPHE